MNDMTVTFDLTLDDLIAFQLARANTSLMTRRWFWKGLRITSLMILLSIPLAIAVMPLLFPHFQAWGSWLLIPIVFLVGWVIAWPHTHRRLMAKSTRHFLSKNHSKGDIGRHNVRINDQGVTEITDVYETHHSWEGIEQMEQDREFIFLLTSPLSGCLIPKRVFGSEKDALLFFEAARAYREKAMMSGTDEPSFTANKPPTL